MKFRVISDLHLDINEGHVPNLGGEDVFTVVCGDTSGSPDETIDWIKENVKRGVSVSGNHLPYNDENRPMQEYRDRLAKAFPADGGFTYLDAECGLVSKEVDGILFVGSCFYSNMEISSEFNPLGSVEVNKHTSWRMMNDYKWGVKSLREDGGLNFITPDDYVEWNRRALGMMEKAVSDNEALENPKPVVVVTHYPMIKDVPAHSFYVDENNFASYGNDMAGWFKRHPSVKCHCCGHCHDMEQAYRFFKVPRGEGGDLLVVNNSYGYWHNWHDMTFNQNRFVNTDTWEVEDLPEPADVIEEKKQRRKRMQKIYGMFR